MTYSIDQALSLRYRTPTIIITSSNLAEKGLLSLLIEDETEWQKREGVKKSSFAFYRLRPLRSFDRLQRLMVTKRLFYKEKPLIADFYSRLKLEYLVETQQAGYLVHALLHNKALSDFDLVMQGSPHIVIQGEMLSFCDPNISWQELAPFCEGPKLFSKEAYLKFKKELGETPLVELEGAPLQEEEKRPTLRLVDSTLSFANLEVGNEKELLKAGFVKKLMPTSNYYCPLDRSMQAVQQLLESGWRVLDANAKEIVTFDSCQLHLENSLEITGKAYFSKEPVDIGVVASCMKEQKRLLNLPSGKVGLLSLGKQKELEGFFQEIDIISGKLQLTKRTFHTLSSLPFDAADTTLGATLRAGFKAELCKEKPVSESFHGRLRPYQQEGLNWLFQLYQSGLNGLLADEMGLGKTVQVLALIATIGAKTLIVMPTSLLHQWKAQAHQFLPDKSLLIYHGIDRNPDEIGKFDIVVSSYGTVRSDLAQFQAHEFGMLVIDEAQAIKNSSTLTAQAILQLKAHFRLSLTGTPVENSLSELISHFRFLEPGLLDESLDSLPAIRKKIAPFFLRRKKSDVAKDLPEKIEETVYVTMNEGQQLLYERFLEHLKGGLLKKVHLDGVKKHRMQIFEAILRLRQICCHPLLVPQLVEELAPEAISSGKCDLVLEDIKTLLLEEKKVVLFSQFSSLLALLANEAKKQAWPYLLLDGTTQNRQSLVDTFQNDPQMPLFFISLKAGGVGLNLSKADYVLIYDPWWNRAQEDQAIDRAHRIGRKDVVFSKRYLMSDTIEERIRLLQEKKSKLHEVLFEGGESELTLEELTELLL